MILTNEEWARRLAQAEELQRLEVDCVPVLAAGLGMLPGHWFFAVHARVQVAQRTLSYPQKAVISDSCPR